LQLKIAESKDEILQLWNDTKQLIQHNREKPDCKFVGVAAV